MDDQCIADFVEKRYGHLSSFHKEQILKAYKASAKRKKGALLKERGVDVYVRSDLSYMYRLVSLSRKLEIIDGSTWHEAISEIESLRLEEYW